MSHEPLSDRSLVSASSDPDPGEALRRLIDWALEEDVGPGDVTTLLTVPAEVHGLAVIVAKKELVLAGTEAARAVFLSCDDQLEVGLYARDGCRLYPEERALAVHGPLRSILTAERTALNFLGRLSGIATLTARFVEAVTDTHAKVLDTRKTTPGWRHLEKDAVKAGGGFNHRMGLYDFILIKDNHISAAGGITNAVSRARARDGESLPLAVEVTSREELEEALALGVDRLLLDNMTPRAMAHAVRRARELGEARPQLEATGNVTLATVREVAETGVDWISVGALTHSASSADLTLRIAP